MMLDVVQQVHKPRSASSAHCICNIVAPAAPALHPCVHAQTTKVTDTTSLLGVAYSLAGAVTANAWIGASRSGTAVGQGWLWADGTEATALNCGAIGCGPWSSVNPS